MRITVCELPHEPNALATAWDALCAHARAEASDLVLLPELAAIDPLWECAHFDSARWEAAEARSDALIEQLDALGAPHVVATRPLGIDGRRVNQAYVWSRCGVEPLRGKYFLPQEPDNWEATWFERGDATFPAFRCGDASFGVNICTELWALDTYAAYAALGVALVLSPRATAFATRQRWLAAGIVAAVRSGAFSVSSNRVDPTGAYGGGGWIIDPEGEVLALTDAAHPFATCDIDLTQVTRAAGSYPRYVFAAGR